MATLPGLDADVYFGDPDKPLPDWRAEMPDEEDDSDEPTEEDLAVLQAVLGFDPAGLWDEPLRHEYDPDQPRGDDGKWQGGSKGKLARLVSAVAALPGKAVPQRVKDAVSRVKEAVIGRMKKRYGEKTTALILKVGVYAAPIPLPGSHPAAILLSFVTAEIARAFGLIGGEPDEPERMERDNLPETTDDLAAAVREFYRELFEEMGEEAPDLDEEGLAQAIEEVLGED